MLSFWTLFAGAWAVLALVMAVLWLLQRRTGDAGVVDVAWTFGVAGMAVLCAFVGEGDPSRRLVLAVFAGIWGLRLGGHLLVDRVLGGEEDGRYRALRDQWGVRFQPILFWFFQAQALLAVLLAVPFWVVAQRSDSFPTGWDVAAVALWVVAWIGESLADRQLARFRADPANRGRTCRRGLWRWSRHPNYFFEWLHWWVWVLLATPGSLAWLTLGSPLLMLFLILKVTGIPPTEAQALRSRGDDYRDYQRTTSAFLPLPPRSTP